MLVNALSELLIGIYLHEFINNEREISLPHVENTYFMLLFYEDGGETNQIPSDKELTLETSAPPFYSMVV